MNEIIIPITKICPEKARYSAFERKKRRLCHERSSWNCH